MSEESTYNEKETLKLIAEGDDQAYARLFKTKRCKIYNFLLRITKFPEIAEELTMDIFLKLWIGRDLLLQINDLDAFLYKVAHNKALDFFRTAARHNRLHEAYTEHINRLHETGLTTTVDNDNLELLKKIINRLPPRRKLIYKLSKEENMTYEQIAIHLNLSTKTVKNTMLSALKDIRRNLSQKDGNGGVLVWMFFLS